jgi:hypothetical protein
VKKLIIIVLLFLVVYPLVISADEWKVEPKRNEMLGETLIIENPNK